MELSYRNFITSKDYEDVYELLEETGFFYEKEINHCLNMMEETIEYGNENEDYRWIIVESHNKLVGLACFSKHTISENSWELHWIAVQHNMKNKNIGSTMINDLENVAKTNKAGSMWIQSSGRKKYKPTINFFISKGYKQVASLKNFYGNDDPKLFFYKKL